MSDKFILRSAAIDLIRKQKGSLTDPCPQRVVEDTYDRIIRSIKQFSAADVEPVIHCKDCQKWHRDEAWCEEHSHFIGSEGEACHPWESSDWKTFDENYFCADAVRREGT